MQMTIPKNTEMIGTLQAYRSRVPLAG